MNIASQNGISEQDEEQDEEASSMGDRKESTSEVEEFKDKEQQSVGDKKEESETSSLESEQQHDEFDNECISSVAQIEFKKAPSKKVRRSSMIVKTGEVLMGKMNSKLEVI